MNKSTTNIMIVGVGGQGSLLASRILGNAALKLNYDVKVSEVHGMSQRGGSVVTYVRYGEKIYSPVICRGEADIIIAFEQLEALRWLSYLKKDGIIITSTQKINPMPVITGAAEYPQDTIKTIVETGVKAIDVNAFSLAKQAGTDKASNVVLIGVLAKHMSGSIGKDVYIDALRESINPKLFDVNLAAFNLGYDIDVG
ncbi:MAG: indolepyruvate oxidoreductase subunit beta [Oscillospiraceae bacterium]|nr:indolepyruvate oxidoreductase subunit beta [Oscillospiraceae bacterium]